MLASFSRSAARLFAVLADVRMVLYSVSPPLFSKCQRNLYDHMLDQLLIHVVNKG